MRDFNNAFKTTFINAITPDKSKKEIIFSAVTQIKQTLILEYQKQLPGIGALLPPKFFICKYYKTESA